MKQQAKLTAFLRTTAVPAAKNASLGSSPLRSPRAQREQQEEDIPWPEIDLTGDTAPSPTTQTSSSSSLPSSPYTPLKRKLSSGRQEGEESSHKKPPLQLLSPKRAKMEGVSSRQGEKAVGLESKPDSLEDIEEFESQEKTKEAEAFQHNDFTDEELIAISEQAEQEHRSRKASALSAPSPSLPSPSSSSPSSSVHPFFARAGKGQRWEKEHYEHDCETLAKLLLGQVLVRITSDNQRLAGRIVETEAYLGGEDKGAHSYGGKITKKNKSMFEPPGTAYIYKIYVTNHCFNVSSLGEGAAVLVRALEPVEGLARMRTNRMAGKVSGAPVRDVDLTSGPGKLCQAMEMDLAEDGLDMLTSQASRPRHFLCRHGVLWIEEGKKIDERNVVAGPRINIDYAQEWKDKPLRFHVRGNPHVSKPAFSNNKSSPFRGGKKV